MRKASTVRQRHFINSGVVEKCFSLQRNILVPVSFILEKPYFANLDRKLCTSSSCCNKRDVHSTAEGGQLSLPVFLHAEKHLANTAVVDTQGGFTYADLLHHSMCLAVEVLQLYDALKEMKLNGERIALLTERDAVYVVGQFATWICNGISVPLCESHPASEWEYYLQDAQCSLILVADSLLEKINPVVQKLGVKVKVLSRSTFGSYEKNRWFQADHASNPR